MTIYQIVTDHARHGEYIDTTDPIADFAKRGFTYTGPETRSYLREELRRKPRFDGLAGPMWGGLDAKGDPIIRYEDWDSYNVLSS